MLQMFFVFHSQTKNIKFDFYNRFSLIYFSLYIGWVYWTDWKAIFRLCQHLVHIQKYFIHDPTLFFLTHSSLFAVEDFGFILYLLTNWWEFSHQDEFQCDFKTQFSTVMWVDKPTQMIKIMYGKLCAFI